MNVETKTVAHEYGEFILFGWKKTEETRVRSGRTYHTRYVLARDKDMENYRLISALESKYFHLRSQKKTYTPMEPRNVALAFLIFLIPGIIYVTVKSKQKKKIQAYNREIQKEMDAVLAEVKPLL